MIAAWTDMGPEHERYVVEAVELTRAQLEALRAKLNERERELERDAERVADDAKPVSLETPIGRLSRMDAIQQQQMAEARKKRVQASLSMVRAARARMAQDEYGHCLRCEENIGFSRLQARPEAPFCLSCQK